MTDLKMLIKMLACAARVGALVTSILGIGIEVNFCNVHL